MSATEQKKEEDETEVEETDMKNNEKSKEAKVFWELFLKIFLLKIFIRELTL